MTTFPLGIDVSKLKFDACLVRDSGKLRHRAFPNSPAGFAQLSAWLEKHGAGQVHACLEATGAYGDSLATYLHDAGHLVSLAGLAPRLHESGSSVRKRARLSKVGAPRLPSRGV